MHCLKLVYRKNYFNPTKIFVLRLLKIVENQRVPGLNRGPSSNLLLLRRTNHVNFTEECGMCSKKNVLVKKNIYKWAKHEFTTWNLSKKRLSIK